MEGYYRWLMYRECLKNGLRMIGSIKVSSKLKDKQRELRDKHYQEAKRRDRPGVVGVGGLMGVGW